MSRTGPPPGFVWRTAEESARRAKAKNAARLAAARSGRSAIVSAARGPFPAGIQRLYGRPSTQEVKFFDCKLTNPAVGGFGLPMYNTPPVGGEPGVAFVGITEVNCVPQGAAAYNRVGTKIVLKSIKFDTTFYLQGSAPSNAVVRWMIVYDRQTNGAFPSFSSILSENISTAPGLYSGVNMANRSRFLVLRQQCIAMDPEHCQAYHASAYIRTNLETQFVSNTTTIGDITTGGLYLVCFSDGNVASTYVNMSQARFRIRYYD